MWGFYAKYRLVNEEKLADSYDRNDPRNVHQPCQQSESIRDAIKNTCKTIYLVFVPTPFDVLINRFYEYPVTVTEPKSDVN